MAYPFPDNYTDSRTCFRIAATALGAQLSSYPLNAEEHSDLSIDIAQTGASGLPTVVVSSGLHGVECNSGAAVQLAWMAAQAKRTLPVRMVLIHSLNPYGFSYGRRVNEDNVDLNRNFFDNSDVSMVRSHAAPSDYARFDSLLNPPHPPRYIDGFLFQALGLLAKEGKSALQRSIVSGQYEFERGLFFGGKEPTKTASLIKNNMHEWIGDAPEVCHLDFHTGLGRFARCQLLVQSLPTSAAWEWYERTFGMSELVPTSTADSQAYEANGAMGNWLGKHFSDRPYRFLTAEFGTYSPLKMLGALRKENQSFHFCAPRSKERDLARRYLEDCFCPSSASWRRAVVARGVSLIEQARNSLTR